MATRAFKFTDFNDLGTEEFIRFFEEENISKKYNPYGLYHKVENLEEYLKEYQDAWNEEKESELWENEEEFADQYEWEYNCHSYTGKPTELVCPFEEEWVSDLDGWYNEDGTPADADDSEIMAEFVSEWDGSNWTESILSSDYMSVDVEELPQYANVQDTWVKIGGYKQNNDTRWNEYYYDAETNSVWKANRTLWQSESTTYHLLEGDDKDYAVIYSIYFGWINSIPEALISEALDDMRLKDGERYEVKNESIYFITSDFERKIEWDEIYKNNFNEVPYPELQMEWIEINPRDYRK